MGSGASLALVTTCRPFQAASGIPGQIRHRAFSTKWSAPRLMQPSKAGGLFFVSFKSQNRQLPRRSWALSGALERSRAGPECVARAFRTPSGPQKGPRRPQEAPKTAQQNPETLKNRPVAPKMAPRQPKKPPRQPKRAPEASQESPEKPESSNSDGKTYIYGMNDLSAF
eukprot:9468236-Pyramimonas_sp.AAC.1